MKRIVAGLICFCAFMPLLSAQETVSDPLNLGNKRELFLDDYLIGTMAGGAELLVHQPTRQPEQIEMNKPWEGSGCCYPTFLYDDVLKVYRFYYNSWQMMPGEDLPQHGIHIAVMESKDGLHWERPNLGLVEFDGSKENNLIFPQGHDFSPFIDKNPDAKPEGRYKATCTWAQGGLWMYQSPDGIHWEKMQEDYVLTGWLFDSQNIAFWSEAENQYVLYGRVSPDIRRVARAVSKDAIHWEDQGLIQFPEGEGPRPQAEYYVNQIAPYYRAPHLYIGFPTRYCDYGVTESTRYLPEWEARQKRIAIEQRWGTATTDCVYISSRDGVHFRQSNDVFITPGLRTKDNWSYGDNYITWGMVEVPSTDADSPNELSFYNTESNFTGSSDIFRRMTIRIDGFGSIHAKTNPGTVTTKPLIFDGNQLTLNYRTSSAGALFVEICDEQGNVIPGYEKDNCDMLYGDSLDRIVTWQGKADVSALSGKAVMLKFYLREADVFSLQFVP